jgi:tetratricopeptide (TPR) repeat protein
MNMPNPFCARTVLLGCLLALLSLGAGADEIQDINTLLKQGQTDEALKRVDAYLAKNPKDVKGRFEKGLILTAQGKANDAIQIFTGMTEEFPELPEPYNNLAVLYAEQGQYDKARTALEMAIRTQPTYATAYENLGDIYAKMASQAYGHALQLKPDNTGVKTKLSRIDALFPAPAAGSSKPGTTLPAQPASSVSGSSAK